MSLLDELFSRRAVWVTGKGGVGKSTISAALALLASRRGLRTLIIDVHANGDAADFLGAGTPSYEAKRITDNLFHLALHPEEVLDEYLQVALKVPRVRRLGPIRKVFDFIATGAPGVKEVLISGKVGFEERAEVKGKPRWDVIIVDAAPSGQVVSHLRGPRTIQEMVGVGLIRNQTAWVREILEDPAKTCLVIVSLAEEMPVAETSELLEQLPEQVSIPVVALVANRIAPQPPSEAPVAQGLAAEAAALMTEIATDQAPLLERLKELGPPVLEVPLIGWDEHRIEATALVADALEASARDRDGSTG